MDRICLFNRLIDILSRNCIPYAIVGRTEGYPKTIGSDIDIIIPRDKIKKFQESIWEFEDENTKIVQMLQHEIVAFYYVIFHFCKKERIFIQPDVCTDYYRKGRLLLTAEYLLQGFQNAPQGGFNVLSHEKEFLYYLIKKVDKCNLSPEQFDHIREHYQANTSKAIKEAKIFWNKENLSIIQDSLDSNNYELLYSNLSKLRDGIHATHRKRILDIVKNVILKLKRIFNPTGFVMAILGPDGSGKTTVINHVKKDIAPAFRQIQQFHLFPIPQTGNEITEKNPQGKKIRGVLLSFLKLLYLLYVYTKGHIMYVLPKKIRSTLTIYDRYYDDILVDPLRYQNGTPKWMVKMIGTFIKEPDLWIVLDCPTDVIQARKAEVSPEETERQRFEYLNIAKTKRNCIVLNTNREINDISIEASRLISKVLNQRTINRYK